MRPIRYVLGRIQDWCLAEEKPPCTILVVSKGHGLQGKGFIAWDASDLDEGFKTVYAYAPPVARGVEPLRVRRLGRHRPKDWPAPVAARPQDTADVYQKVKSRGIAHVVFRLTLLNAYRRQCAFCGLSLEARSGAAISSRGAGPQLSSVSRPWTNALCSTPPCAIQ